MSTSDSRGSSSRPLCAPSCSAGGRTRRSLFGTHGTVGQMLHAHCTCSRVLLVSGQYRVWRLLRRIHILAGLFTSTEIDCNRHSAHKTWVNIYRHGVHPEPILRLVRRAADAGTYQKPRDCVHVTLQTTKYVLCRRVRGAPSASRGGRPLPLLRAQAPSLSTPPRCSLALVPRQTWSLQGHAVDEHIGEAVDSHEVRLQRRRAHDVNGRRAWRRGGIILLGVRHVDVDRRRAHRARRP